MRVEFQILAGEFDRVLFKLTQRTFFQSIGRLKSVRSTEKAVSASAHLPLLARHRWFAMRVEAVRLQCSVGQRNPQKQIHFGSLKLGDATKVQASREWLKNQGSDRGEPLMCPSPIQFPAVLSSARDKSRALCIDLGNGGR